MQDTEVTTKRLRCIKLKALGPDDFPADGQVLLGTGQLEVIDVDHKEELKLWMPVAAFPVFDGLETNLLEMSIAMLFPI